MEEKLIKLMLEYTSKGMLPDKAYIDKLVEIVVCSKDLNDYVKSVSFEYGVNSFDDGVSIASYNPLSSKIKVNADGINIALENYEVYECLFEYYERILHRYYTKAGCKVRANGEWFELSIADINFLCKPNGIKEQNELMETLKKMM